MDNKTKYGIGITLIILPVYGAVAVVAKTILQQTVMGTFGVMAAFTIYLAVVSYLFFKDKSKLNNGKEERKSF